MHIENQNGQLIKNLSLLKPKTAEDSGSNLEKFTTIIADAVSSLSIESSDLEEQITMPGQNKATEISSWVDPDYGNDVKRSGKPNMRELIEAISGKSVEELYKEGPKITQDITTQASEILYGAIGSNKDIRNWYSIMNSEDILHAARIETAKMYKPKIDIETRFDDNGEIIEQVAVLKDINEKKLRVLPNNVDNAEKTLINFGATHLSVPEDLENRITSPKFDEKMLGFLKTFDKNDENLQKVAIQTATENISKKLSEEIPIDELEKL